jgi:outer membrane phospholipase A
MHRPSFPVLPERPFDYGKQRGNEDTELYRGYAGLALAVGRDEGVGLSADGRMSFASEKASVQADLSYPLDKLLWSRLDLYPYGQVFAGYGENLLDYDRNITRARIGIAIVR